MSNANRRWALLLLVLSVALASRLGVAAAVREPSLYYSHDSASYLRPAQALAASEGFGRSAEDPRPETLRTPGYPVFLSLILRASSDPKAIGLVQAVVSTSTVAMVFLLGASIASFREGLVAAGILALDPLSIGFSQQVLTETLFTCLMVGFLLAVATSRWQGHWFTGAAGAGLTLAGATLVRPITYYLILPAGLLLFLSARARVSRRRALWVAVVFLVTAAVPVGAWKLRNLEVAGSPTLSGIEGVSLLYYRAAGVVSSRDGISLDEARARLAGAEANRRRFSPELREADAWRRQGLEVLVSHPWLTAKQVSAGMARIFIGPGQEVLMTLVGQGPYPTGPLGDLLRLDLPGWWHRWFVERRLAGLAFVVAFGLLGGVYLGTALAWSRGAPSLASRGGQWALAVVFLYLVAFSGGPEAYYRFRVPLMPILAIWAALGWSALPARFRPRKSTELQSGS